MGEEEPGSGQSWVGSLDKCMALPFLSIPSPHYGMANHKALARPLHK